YGRNASGTVTEPSGCWQCSMMQAMVRGNARPEPFNVCTNLGLSPFAARKRMFARRAWKSVKLLHDDTSSHAPAPGAHASRSYVIAELKPVSPAANSLRR